MSNNYGSRYKSGSTTLEKNQSKTGISTSQFQKGLRASSSSQHQISQKKFSLFQEQILSRYSYTRSKDGLPGSFDEEETTVTDPPDPEELLQNRQPEQQNSPGIGNNV
jgi:hypothetical protein